MRLKPKAGDYFVFIIVTLAAVLMLILFYQHETSEKIAVILQDGIEIERIRLDTIDKKVTMEYQGAYPGFIEAEKGRIRFKEASCPDQVCVHTGWISRTGQIAVCLPGNVIIKLEGLYTENDTDIILH